MNLQDKAMEMRSAIDAIELALNGIPDFDTYEPLWQDARSDIKIKMEMTVGTMRQIVKAYEELNRIINEPEYSPANL